MTPEDLHQDTLRRLVQRKAEALRIAAGHRQLQAEAKAAGDAGIARQLGMLAAHMEQAAALAEAERRDRIAVYTKLQGGRQARASSVAARQKQAELDDAKVAELFRNAFRAGMGRVGLQAAAMRSIGVKEDRLRERLISAQQAANKRLQRQLSAELESLTIQTARCTVHRAGKWLEQHRESG